MGVIPWGCRGLPEPFKIEEHKQFTVLRGTSSVVKLGYIALILYKDRSDCFQMCYLYMKQFFRAELHIKIYSCI